MGIDKLAVGNAEVAQTVDWVFGCLVLAAFGRVLLQRVDQVLASVADVQLRSVQRGQWSLLVVRQQAIDELEAVFNLHARCRLEHHAGVIQLAYDGGGAFG